MPVAQKTGPDGCLYVLDWYDRYHCYQDANRDPKGIDRLKGRLYRVRYKDTPRRGRFDLAKHSDEDLIAWLGTPTATTARRPAGSSPSATGAETDKLLAIHRPEPRQASRDPNERPLGADQPGEASTRTSS